MVSSVDTAKRVLVTLLKSLAGIGGVVLSLTRESTDVEVRAAYRKVSRKAHPDQGGAPEPGQILTCFHLELPLRRSGSSSDFQSSFFTKQQRHSESEDHNTFKIHDVGFLCSIQGVFDII